MANNNKKTTGELAEKYCKKYPDMPTLTLARKLYGEQKKVYSTLDHARSVIKYYRGQLGDFNRKRRSSAAGEQVDGRTFNYAPYKAPESDNEAWDPFLLPVGDYKLLVISDVHLPYHDPQALEIAINYGIQNGCNSLLINGDLFDGYQGSRFQKDPRKRSLGGELEIARNFLKDMAGLFRHVYFKEGNHDERWNNYFLMKAPELLDIHEFKLPVILKLAEHGIHHISDKRIINVGHLSILHGHEFFGGTSQAVNPARGLYLKTNESCLIGHLHKSSEHTETSLSGKITTTWSVGCLAGLHPDYARINKWNHGFAVVEVKKGGGYNVHNKRIFEGKVL